MPGQLNITIETKEVDEWFKKLEKSMDLKQSRAILRKASTRTIVKGLRGNMTVNSRNLKKSFGNVTGKSKQPAVIFAGPRMDRDHQSKRKTPMGSIAVTVAAKYKGHLANIIENNTYRPRYPRDIRRDLRTPRIPALGAYPFNIRAHTGIFRARPFIAKTYKIQGKSFLKEVLSQAKKIIEAA